MKHHNEIACVVVVALAMSASAGAFAQATAYPMKAVRMIVASTPGSNPDTSGRVFAEALTQQLRQQVIVDNRAGAGGNIGAEAAARAPADGYTIFFAHTNHSINSSLYRKLAYDLIADFAPVSLVASSAFVASVHPSLPAKSVRDLINIARARPGDLNYASAGTGSGTFFAAEYLSALGKVKMVHVPYTGGGPALASVVSGETSVYFTPLAVGLPHMKTGRLRPLGVTSTKRLPEIPDVPPIADTLPGYEVLAWAGLLVPVKTSKEIVEALHKATTTALARPEVSKRLEDMGYLVVPSKPEEMTAYLKREIAKYAALIKQTGMPLQ